MVPLISIDAAATAGPEHARFLLPCRRQPVSRLLSPKDARTGAVLLPALRTPPAATVVVKTENFVIYCACAHNMR